MGKESCIDIINLQKLLNVHPPLRLEGKMSKLGGKKEVATVVTLPKVTSVKAALDDHSNTESVSDIYFEFYSKLCSKQDLFNFLRQMHLTGGANGMTVGQLTFHCFYQRWIPPKDDNNRFWETAFWKCNNLYEFTQHHHLAQVSRESGLAGFSGGVSFH